MFRRELFAIFERIIDGIPSLLRHANAAGPGVGALVKSAPRRHRIGISKGSFMAKRYRICVDRPISLHHKPDAAALSIAENTVNRPPMSAILRPGAMAGVSFHPLKMAIQTGKKWANGRTLGVRFLDGSTTQTEKVIAHANTWSKYANINFNFNAGANAEIRISFIADDGSWSAMGTDCLHRPSFPLNEPTMNYGWLRDNTDDTEYRRVVIHEFGHALGAIHEHQNPKGGIQWNVQAVLGSFGGAPNNWSEADIRSNILDKYSLDQLNATKFDKKSIMLYFFPPELVGGLALPENNELSTKDKAWIKKNYPKPVGKPKAAKSAGKSTAKGARVIEVKSKSGSKSKSLARR